MAKLNQEENLIEMRKSATEYPLPQELARKTCTFWQHLHLRVSIFNDEVLEERVLDGNLESQLKLMVSREVPDFAGLAARMQDGGSH